MPAKITFRPMITPTGARESLWNTHVIGNLPLLSNRCIFYFTRLADSLGLSPGPNIDILLCTLDKS